MSIDFDVFRAKFPVLTERFRQNFSAPTLAEWYDYLDQNLTTEEFLAVVRHFFQSELDFMPKPRDLVEYAESKRPRECFTALEAAKEKAFVDMSPEEQQAHLAAIARARAMVKNIGNGMTAIGKALDTSGWAQDPILSKELPTTSYRP